MDILLNTAPCGFLTFTDSGIILQVNDTLLALLNSERDGVQGQPLASLIAAGGAMFYQMYLFPLLEMRGEVKEIYLALRTSADVQVPVLLNAVRRERQAIMVTDCVVVPIHQRSRYEDELLQAKKQAEQAMQAKQRANSDLEQARLALEAKQQEHEHLIRKLQQALTDVTTLRGLIPICSVCKNIRDDHGYWNKLENYLQLHTHAEFSHSLCPTCSDAYFSDLPQDIALASDNHHLQPLTVLRKIAQYPNSVPAAIWAWAQRNNYSPDQLFAFLDGDLATLDRMLHVRVPPPGDDHDGNIEIIAATFQLNLLALQTVLNDIPTGP